MGKLICCLVFFCLLNIISAISKHGLTIVISLDGFYYKYFEENVTPTLKRLRDEGSRALYMNNIFPTKTYPNHFTIVTGRYAEEHGVLENRLFDPILNKSLDYSEELFTFNKSMLPIWALNEKAGDGRHSGVMMWPGGEFEYNGTKPTYTQSFSFKIAFLTRVDMILKWILDPVKPANLIFLYIQEPDGIGHVFGPASHNVTERLVEVDNVTKYLINKLKENHVSNYNLIMLSDHGMSPVKVNNIINISTIISNETYHLYGTGPTLSLYPVQGKYDEVLSKFREASMKNNSHFKIYTKDEIPAKWRYKNSPRAAPLFLLSDDEYNFDVVWKNLEFNERYFNVTYEPNSTFGTHGYETFYDHMHPFFFAHGPAFKRNHTINIFDNVDLYSLFSHVLNLKISSSSHSGNFSHVQDIFQQVSGSNKVFSYLNVYYSIILFFIIQSFY